MYIFSITPGWKYNVEANVSPYWEEHIFFFSFMARAIGKGEKKNIITLDL